MRRIFMDKFQNLSIGTKISGAVLIFLFPFLLLGYFLITEKEELINFTRQEVAGVHYLRAAHEVLATVASSPAKEAFGKAADVLNKAEQADAGITGATQKTHDLIVMLQNAAAGKD